MVIDSSDGLNFYVDKDYEIFVALRHHRMSANWEYFKETYTKVGVGEQYKKKIKSRRALSFLFHVPIEYSAHKCVSRATQHGQINRVGPSWTVMVSIENILSIYFYNSFIEDKIKLFTLHILEYLEKYLIVNSN